MIRLSGFTKTSPAIVCAHHHPLGWDGPRPGKRSHPCAVGAVVVAAVATRFGPVSPRWDATCAAWCLATTFFSQASAALAPLQAAVSMLRRRRTRWSESLGSAMQPGQACGRLCRSGGRRHRNLRHRARHGFAEGCVDRRVAFSSPGRFADDDAGDQDRCPANETRWNHLVASVRTHRCGVRDGIRSPVRARVESRCGGIRRGSLGGGLPGSGEAALPE